MSDNKLKIFVTVVRTGSFTAAAHKLGCSQPSISQNILQLETEAGGQLLERSRGEVHLTPKGERFYKYAERMLALYRRLELEMNGGEVQPDDVLLDLGSGNTAEVGVRDGKIEITLKSANN